MRRMKGKEVVRSSEKKRGRKENGANRWVGESEWKKEEVQEARKNNRENRRKVRVVSVTFILLWSCSMGAQGIEQFTFASRGESRHDQRSLEKL